MRRTGTKPGNEQPEQLQTSFHADDKQVGTNVRAKKKLRDVLENPVDSACHCCYSRGRSSLSRVPCRKKTHRAKKSRSSERARDRLLRRHPPQTKGAYLLLLGQTGLFLDGLLDVFHARGADDVVLLAAQGDLDAHGVCGLFLQGGVCTCVCVLNVGFGGWRTRGKERNA